MQGARGELCDLQVEQGSAPNDAASPISRMLATRSGQSSHGLERTVNQAPKIAATPSKTRDSRLARCPAKSRDAAATPNVTVRARPNVPVRKA